ncbi:unnamed protein product [Trichogramma brassicae]|uniref:Uncharacterized protein n=1 Tax=Trichogramma brassicae TaxID=86971 RepID=A0A6H5I2H4_9HYME|nr:unnamed protein product [Trichogramma brassicae]
MWKFRYLFTQIDYSCSIGPTVMWARCGGESAMPATTGEEGGSPKPTDDDRWREEGLAGSGRHRPGRPDVWACLLIVRGDARRGGSLAGRRPESPLRNYLVHNIFPTSPRGCWRVRQI